MMRSIKQTSLLVILFMGVYSSLFVTSYAQTTSTSPTILYASFGNNQVAANRITVTSLLPNTIPANQYLSQLGLATDPAPGLDTLFVLYQLGSSIYPIIVFDNADLNLTQSPSDATTYPALGPVTSSFTVLAAFYGSRNGKFINVTANMPTPSSSNQITFSQSMNSQFGITNANDPAYGFTKGLIVVFAVNQNLYVQMLGENDTVTISVANAVPVPAYNNRTTVAGSSDGTADGTNDANALGLGSVDFSSLLPNDSMFTAANAYVNAYDAAFYSTRGAIDGVNSTAALSTVDPAGTTPKATYVSYRNAFNSAFNGKNDALASKAMSTTDTSSAYVTAYNNVYYTAARGTSDGTTAGNADGNPNRGNGPVDTTLVGTPAYKAAYTAAYDLAFYPARGAVDGAGDGANATTTAPVAATTLPTAYQTAYNAAATSAFNGKNDALTYKPMSPSDTSTAYTTAYNNTYTDAVKTAAAGQGFADGTHDGSMAGSAAAAAGAAHGAPPLPSMDMTKKTAEYYTGFNGNGGYFPAYTPAYNKARAHPTPVLTSTGAISPTIGTGAPTTGTGTTPLGLTSSGGQATAASLLTSVQNFVAPASTAISSVTSSLPTSSLTPSQKIQSALCSTLSNDLTTITNLTPSTLQGPQTHGMINALQKKFLQYQKLANREQLTALAGAISNIAAGLTSLEQALKPGKGTGSIGRGTMTGTGTTTAPVTGATPSTGTTTTGAGTGGTSHLRLPK